MINTQSIFVRSTNLLLMPLVDSLCGRGEKAQTQKKANNLAYILPHPHFKCV